MIPEQHRKKAAWITICLGCTAAAEGVRQNAYPDVTGIPTICFGETKGVQMGEHRTLDECKVLLEGRLYEFGAEVDKCTKPELPASRKAAMTDFAYNEGSGRYCRNIAPLLNAGRTQEACEHLLLYDKAGGVVFPGLTRRREKERNLCMEGIT